MNRITNSRRTHVVLGALAATAALAALPAMASASTGCNYDPANQLIQITMDGGPTKGLTITRGGITDERVFVRAANEVFRTCAGPLGSFATLSNTDLIEVRRAAVDNSSRDIVTVDESRGRLVSANGNAPSVAAFTGTGGDVMRVVGSSGIDRYAVSGAAGRENHVRLGGDGAGFTMESVGSVELNGGAGVDTLGRSPFDPIGPTTPLVLNGGSDQDTLRGGQSGQDVITGGQAQDSVNVSNQKGGDRADGGDGHDNVVADFGDIITNFEAGGELKVASRTVTAGTAKPGVLSMSWTHPTAWKNLRTITVKAYDGAKQVGAVTIKPRSERITGSGALKLAASETSIAKQGKTVTVRLGLLASKALTGKTLRLDVHAADRNGSRQVESGAAKLRVAK